MARGKTISVYLMDGIADGKIKAYISNWNGVAYKIPRRLLSDCKDFDAFNQSGVYFLFGNESVYVGQAEVRKTGKGIHQRILDHESDKYKDAWDEVVIFTTKDGSLGKTDISYLEHRFYKKALDAKRFKVLNNAEPSIGTVTEEKADELEEFMDLAELILGALGYKVFEPLMTLMTRIDINGRVRTKGLSEGKINKKKPVNSITKTNIPDLPDARLKIGEYVRTAMRNLSSCGYEFSFDVINEMCSSEWSIKQFHTNKPFMRRFIEGKTNNKDANGNVRFWQEVFTFGSEKVYVSKEWYPRQFELFNSWYNSLR